MRFKINNHEWTIMTKGADEIKTMYEMQSGESTLYVFGMTSFKKNTIYVNEELCQDKTERALKHELLHCYIEEYCGHKDEYTEEDLCDICSCSHDFIEQTTKEYMQKWGKDNE